MAKSSGEEEEDEEALFSFYPYPLYLVQSPPSTVDSSHAASSNVSNYDHHHRNLHHHQLNYNSPMSRYLSSRGSSNSFTHRDGNKKKDNSNDRGLTENGEKLGGGIIMMKNMNEVEIDHDDQDYYCAEDEEEKRGWMKYLSFSYNSKSGWWILMQLSWRFLLSLIIALLVFYVAAKPPPPHLSVKIARIGQFRLDEGVDRSGVTTKILSCNCSIDLIIENQSKLFGLHINPPIIQILFQDLPFAMSERKGEELYAESDDTTWFKLRIGTRNKVMYGAGRNMQDLLESGKGLPLVVKVRLRSSFHVIWGLFQPIFHHQLQCLVVLSDQYDKKHRTQVYNSTCLINKLINS